MARIIGIDLSGREAKSAVYAGGNVLTLPDVPVAGAFAAEDLVHLKGEAQKRLGFQMEGVVFALPLFAPYSTRLRLAQYAMDLGLERVRFIAPSAAMLIAWLMEHPDADDEIVLALSEFATEGILASIDGGCVVLEEVSCLDFDQGEYVPLMPDDEMMKLTSQTILCSGYPGNEVERVLAVSRNMDLASKVARHRLLEGKSPKNEERPLSDVVRGAAIYGAAMSGDFAGNFMMVDAPAYEFSLRLGGSEIDLSTEFRNIPNVRAFHCKYDTGPMEIDLFVSTRTAFGAKVRERYHLGSLADSLQGKEVCITVDINENCFVAITAEEVSGVDASFGKIKGSKFRQEFVPDLENLVDENKAAAPAPVAAKEPTQSEAPNFEDAKRIMLDLLPVLDSFDRSLAAAKGGNTGLRQGMELIERQLLTGLKKNGLERIESEGKMFDPNYHEAVAMVKDKEKEDGSVAAELEKGYLYKGKVLRPSRVSVVTDD